MKLKIYQEKVFFADFILKPDVILVKAPFEFYKGFTTCLVLLHIMRIHTCVVSTQPVFYSL